MKKLILALIVLSALQGCMTLEQKVDKAMAGQPQWLKDAVIDGCRSGKAAAGDIYSRPNKNQEMYETNYKYRQSWDDNYDFCKTRYLRNTRY